ncbi:DUF4198 domain-containing protein [Blastopirellula marina]|uniref:DUF4198 domain-containing protein n=1 Tax=Blastopirellula marina DSM 3645 TaxID=314230 RepID=A3ZYP8_9BACT|nr:DUF4198 domain-containing protein [Blastopirellula marina]EAQ78340.1 hypothetical protein DSM3645_18426 [Blastopirellula marina DSM 3645]
MFVRALLCLLCFSTPLCAHDTWVETNSNVIRTGDAIYVDLKLGNHGNDHRDFKLASKIDLAGCSLNIVAPSGKEFDLIPELVDVGYAPKEGFWNAKFAAAKPGLYQVSHALDKIVNHGHPVRSLKSGKTFFLVSDTLDKVAENAAGFDQPQGHPLELVPQVSTVAPMGPGQAITVQLLLRGKPLSDTVVSFVPRRATLKADWDETYERKTDPQGIATFTPTTGDQYLIVAHHHATDEKTAEYDETAYSATLTVLVPEICPCCGE